MFLGEVLVDDDDAQQAFAPFAETLRLIRETGDIDLTWSALDHSARALVLGRPGRAARLMGAAEAIRAAHAIPLPPVYRRDMYDALLARARHALAPEAFDAAWAAGRAMTREQAIADALDALDPTVDQQLAHAREPLDEPPVTAPDTVAAPTSPVPGATVLTRRQREVAACLGRGLSNRDIALELNISERTAERHVENILAKLALRSRTEVALWASRHGEVADRAR
jgi:DNA-binding NarL/FixJ family response regulator